MKRLIIYDWFPKLLKILQTNPSKVQKKNVAKIYNINPKRANHKDIFNNKK